MHKRAITRGLYVAAAAALFVACTSLRTAKSNPTPIQEEKIGGYIVKDDTLQGTASYYYFQGIKALNIAGDASQAAVYYNKALELDSLHAPSYYELAGIEAGDNIKKALDLSTKANELDASNIWYKTQLGGLLILNLQYDSALAVYNELIKLAPNYPENYRYLAALHEQIGQPYTAIIILDSAEMKFGVTEELSSYKRQLLINTRQTDRAIAETKVLANNFPYDEKNYVILGDLYAAKGDDSLAREAYDQAFAIDSNSLQVIASFAEFNRRKGDIPGFFSATQRLFTSDQIDVEDKIGMFKEITQNVNLYREYYFTINSLVSSLVIKHPDNYEITKLYTTHLIKGGGIEEALRVYKNSLSDTVRMDAINSIIDIESYLNRADSVDRYYDIALRHFPANPDLYMRRGYGQMFMKNYKEAEKTMRAALKYADSDSLKSAIYSNIGDIRHAADSTKIKRYYPLYEKALEYNPDNIHALNNYSYYLSLEGKNLDRALEMIKKVLEVYPDNPTYIDTYGWILYKLGRYEEAKSVMRRAVMLDATASPELLAHYGDVLYELKDYFMASVYWNKALEKGYDKTEIEKRLKSIEGK